VKVEKASVVAPAPQQARVLRPGLSLIGQGPLTWGGLSALLLHDSSVQYTQTHSGCVPGGAAKVTISCHTRHPSAEGCPAACVVGSHVAGRTQTHGPV
jgi:hypothetical protein